MSRAETLQLISDLTAAQSDDAEASVIYDEVVRELGYYEILTNQEKRLLEKDACGIFGLASDTIRMLELAWNNRRIDRASEFALRTAYGASWRARVGEPVAATVWDESANEFRLVPRPNEDGTVSTLRTETRDDLPYWLELPVALLTIAREFDRESNHQDIAYAQVALQLGQLFLRLLDVPIVSAQQQQREQQ